MVEDGTHVSDSPPGGSSQRQHRLKKKTQNQDAENSRKATPCKPNTAQHRARTWRVVRCRAVDLLLQLLDTDAGIVLTLIARQQGRCTAERDIRTLLMDW